jgi:hypothetical protein
MKTLGALTRNFSNNFEMRARHFEALKMLIALNFLTKKNINLNIFPLSLTRCCRCFSKAKARYCHLTLLKITSPIQMSSWQCKNTTHNNSFILRQNTLCCLGEFQYRRSAQHNEEILLLLFFPSQDNAAQKNEMAFRLHHYEALKCDKESLQMPS